MTLGDTRSIRVFGGTAFAVLALALGCSGSHGAGGGGGHPCKLGGFDTTGCTPDGGGSSGGGSGGSSAGGSGGSGGAPNDGGSCAMDPLKTGLTAMQTGVSVDAFDCEVLQWTAKYHEPDPMIFKAIMYVESRFDDTSVACSNDPCSIPKGWTAAESGCFGLMQVVPACGGSPNNAGLLSNGQPNLTKTKSSSLWATSIFNPEVNIEIGIAGVAGNRAQVEKQFPGCTTDQYTLLAVGNYNSYGSSKSCTVYNTAYDGPGSELMMAYQEYSKAAGYTPHGY